MSKSKLPRKMKMKMKMKRVMGIEHNEKSAVLNGTAEGPTLEVLQQL